MILSSIMWRGTGILALNKNCDLLFKSVVVQESSSTCFADEPCKYRFKKYVGVDYTKGRFSLALCFIPGVQTDHLPFPKSVCQPHSGLLQIKSLMDYNYIQHQQAPLSKARLTNETENNQSSPSKLEPPQKKRKMELL